MLIATELAFDHPRDGHRVELKLPLPKEMTPE
jgi:23S rRNA-/tRNA-specific pseudouridylate synthase